MYSFNTHLKEKKKAVSLFHLLTNVSKIKIKIDTVLHYKLKPYIKGSGQL